MEGNGREVREVRQFLVLVDLREAISVLGEPVSVLVPAPVHHTFPCPGLARTW